MENYNLFNEYSSPKNGFGKFINFEDKDRLYNYHMLNFAKKLRCMFEYNGLPKQIPQRDMELQIQRGYTIIFPVDGVFYQAYGGLGGRPDHNYMPTIATIAVPALFGEMKNKYRIYWGYETKFEELKELTPCVVIPNDSLFIGTIPTNSYYASQLVENDLTMNCNLINFRLMNLLVASDSDAYESLTKVIKSLKDGKISCAVDDNWILDAIKSLPFGNNSGNNIVQLLEQRQYIKGSWWNEFGVQSNYNMKRETITSSENILNVDSLLPAIDDMLDCRKKACERIKELWGLDWSVDYSSAWKKLRKEIKVKEDILQKEADKQEVQKSDDKVEKSDNDGDVQKSDSEDNDND